MAILKFVSTVLLAGVIIPNAAFAISIQEKTCYYHQTPEGYEIAAWVMLSDYDPERPPKKALFDVSLEAEEGPQVERIKGKCELDSNGLFQCVGFGENITGKPNVFKLTVYDKYKDKLISSRQQECEHKEISG